LNKLKEEFDIEKKKKSKGIVVAEGKIDEDRKMYTLDNKLSNLETHRKYFL
jgi:hypothetical protein